MSDDAFQWLGRIFYPVDGGNGSRSPTARRPSGSARPAPPRSRRSFLAAAGLTSCAVAFSGCADWAGPVEGGGSDDSTEAGDASGTGTAPRGWTTVLPAPLGVRFGDRVSAALGHADGVLAVVSAGSTSVVGLDSAGGERRWTAEFDEEPHDVSVHRGDVYTRCGDRTVARHAPDGTERWRGAPDPRAGVDRPLQIGRSLFVAADSERLYLVTGPGDDEAGPLAQILYALDRSDGSLVWASPVGGGSYHARRISADDQGRLLVGSTVNGLAGYAVADGTRLWHTGRGPEPLVVAEPAAARFGAYGRLLVHDDHAFVRTRESGLAAVDVHTGERAWSRPLYPSVTAGAIVDGTLVFDEASESSADHRARGLAPDDGSDRSTVDLGAVPAGPPVADDGVLYAPFLEYSSGSAPEIVLIAVDVTGGSQRWRTTVLEGTVDRPVVSLDVGGGGVVVTVNDTDDPAFADTYVVAVSVTDGTVSTRQQVEDHAAAITDGDAVYVAEEFSGTVRRFDRSSALGPSTVKQ